MAGKIALLGNGVGWLERSAAAAKRTPLSCEEARLLAAQKGRLLSAAGKLRNLLVDALNSGDMVTDEREKAIGLLERTGPLLRSIMPLAESIH